ncbi:MAG: hypothetical protein SFV32_02810 [Opitutaceae bacterium]|nr:hypothetical protein [Opitutaceae bacterium]
MNTSETYPGNSSTNNTVDELRALLAEAERALANTGETASDELESLRDRLRSALDEGKRAAGRAAEYAKEKARCADEFVHTKPYTALAIAAGVGLLAGVLATRRH